MRSVHLVAILCALVLSACGSPTPTPTPTPTPETTPELVSDQGPFGDMSDLEGTVVVPIPGTLVRISPGFTPGAPLPEPISIDSLTFSQTGGIAAITVTIELQGDGTLNYNGETSTVSVEAVQNIARLLDGIDFYNMQGIFISPNFPPDAFRYTLRVDSSSGSRTISSQDGLTPPELYAVYDAIRMLGQT